MFTRKEGDAARHLGPSEFSAEAEQVEQGRFVSIDPRRQNESLPRRGGHFEAIELVEDRAQAVDAGELVRHMLPGEEEAREVGRADRLDLRTQAIQRVAMDPSEQSPIAPLELRRTGE